MIGSREHIPTVSKLCAMGTTPATEIAPCEGRNPNMPQYAAGTRTLPAVSVPNKRKWKIFNFLWYTSWSPTTCWGTNSRAPTSAVDLFEPYHRWFWKLGALTKWEVHKIGCHCNSWSTWRTPWNSIWCCWIYWSSIMLILSIDAELKKKPPDSTTLQQKIENMADSHWQIPSCHLHLKKRNLCLPKHSICVCNSPVCKLIHVKLASTFGTSIHEHFDSRGSPSSSQMCGCPVWVTKSCDLPFDIKSVLTRHQGSLIIIQENKISATSPLSYSPNYCTSDSTCACRHKSLQAKIHDINDPHVKASLDPWLSPPISAFIFSLHFFRIVGLSNDSKFSNT